MKFFKKNIILTVILVGLSVFIYLNFTQINNYERYTDTKDPYFINELYKSEQRVYNNYLNEKEKKIYDHLIELTRTYTPSEKVNPSDFDCKDYHDFATSIINATEALWVDHPELMNFASYTYTYNERELTLRISYAYVFPFMDIIGVLRIENIISKIKEETKDMTDEEKIKYVYEWMGNNNTYDSLFTQDSKNQSIYNVFVKKNAVCAGFAKASHLIFSQIGIESYIVSGYSTGPHMWNIVKYNDKYYFFDSTVSVSLSENYGDWHYKGLDQSYLNSFRVDYPSWYPKIETTNMFD